MTHHDYEETSLGCNQRNTGTTEQVHRRSSDSQYTAFSAVQSLKIPVVSEKNKAVFCKLSLLIHAGIRHIFSFQRVEPLM